MTSIKRRPKSYFSDVGLRNYLASALDKMQQIKEKGCIAENIVFNQLLKFNSIYMNDMGELYFWRNPDGNEVDFIFKYGNTLIPIEVKYQKTAQVKINRGMKIFLKREGFDFAIIFTENKFGQSRIDDIHYFFIPLYMLAGI